MDSDLSLARTSLPDKGQSAPARARRTSASGTVPTTNPLNPLPLPRWIGADLEGESGRGSESSGQGRETRFAAGAAIFAIDQIVRSEPQWFGCWRMRLTLKAATAAAKRLRLSADESALRDALHLTRAGDDPGPAGRLHLLLRRWAARPLRLATETDAELLQEVADIPAAAEVAALLAADRALAERVGWASPLPLYLAAIDDATLRGGPEGRRLRADAAGLAVMAPVLLLRSAMTAHAEAVTLARRAEVVTAAAAALRTRDEGRGLALILADDSVAAWRMAGSKLPGKDGMSSDRAARRFCESLHARGALRLLTDRPSLRLYGL
jgi:hypothetical protein